MLPQMSANVANFIFFLVAVPDGSQLNDRRRSVEMLAATARRVCLLVLGAPLSSVGVQRAACY